MARLAYKRVLVVWWVVSAGLLLAGIAWGKIVDHRLYKSIPSHVIRNYAYPWGAGALVLAGFLGLLLVGLTHCILYMVSKRQPPE